MNDRDHTESRACEWCREAISAEALKCPKCGKWRRDIERLRMRNYTCAAGTLAVGLAASFLFLAGIKSGAFLSADGLWRTTFSMEKFLTHPLGWMTIVWFLFAGGLAYLTLRSASALKRKGYE